MRELEKSQLEFLVNYDIKIPKDNAFHFLNNDLFDIACSYWNPRSNTFFFWIGEMTVLLEEVGSLLGICEDLRIGHNSGYYPSFIDGSLSFDHALQGILKTGANYEEVTKDGNLNLELLWMMSKHYLKSDKLHE